MNNNQNENYEGNLDNNDNNDNNNNENLNNKHNTNNRNKRNKPEFLTYDKIYESLLNNKQRYSIPYLTKYEKSRIIGIRAKQISKNSPPLVDTDNLICPKEIALKELKERKIPMIIKRHMPNGNIEHWRIDELKFDFS